MSCKRRCIYATPESARGALGHGCNYIVITGQSRIKAVYDILGVDSMTREAEEMLENNCPCFNSGKRRPAGPAMTQLVFKDENSQNYTGDTIDDRRKFDQRTALALWRKGLTDAKIGEQLGVSKTAILHWRHKYGLQTRIRTRLPNQKITDLYKQGLTDAEIAVKLSIRARQVARWRAYHKLACNMAEHKKVDYADVRRMYDEGRTDKLIAEAANCSQVTIAKWRQREKLPANRAKRISNNA